MSTRPKQECPSCKMKRKEWANLVSQLNAERDRAARAEADLARAKEALQLVRRHISTHWDRPNASVILGVVDPSGVVVPDAALSPAPEPAAQEKCECGHGRVLHGLTGSQCYVYRETPTGDVQCSCSGYREKEPAAQEAKPTPPAVSEPAGALGKVAEKVKEAQDVAYSHAATLSSHQRIYTALCDALTRLDRAAAEHAALVKERDDLYSEVYGTDPLAGNPLKWGLRAMLEGVQGQRDAALSRAEQAEKERDEARARVSVLETLAKKVDAIRNSIIGMQGFNFSEHAYPLVAALEEAGFPGEGYEIASKNRGTLIEQRDRAEAARDAALSRAEQAEKERDAINESRNAHVRMIDSVLSLAAQWGCDTIALSDALEFLNATLANGAQFKKERDEAREELADTKAYAEDVRKNSVAHALRVRELEGNNGAPWKCNVSGHEHASRLEAQECMTATANDRVRELEAQLAARPVAPDTLARLEAVTLADLRAANVERQREWDKDEGIDATYRGVELAGEVGEALNVLKKLERERRGIRGSRATVGQLAEELADVVICVDLVAMQYGIDLGAATVAKFNATSEKVGLRTRIEFCDADPGHDGPCARVGRRYPGSKPCGALILGQRLERVAGGEGKANG